MSKRKFFQTEKGKTNVLMEAHKNHCKFKNIHIDKYVVHVHEYIK